MACPQVLIVDDDPDLRAALRRELCGAGYDCAEAGDADEAMAVMSDQLIDAVVSDYDMPGMNGLDLLQRIRLGHPHVFRILLTGRADVEMAARALNEGAAHRFLLKPWNRVALSGILEMALHSRRSERIRVR